MNAPRTHRLRLIVATNFSRKSSLALDYSLTYSQTVNAEVYLFHCHEAKVKDFREHDRLTEEMMEKMRVASMEAVERARAKGVQYSVENVFRRISHGKPWEEILRITAGTNADMIVMGAPTTTAFRRLIEATPCTMVLVREKDAEFVAA